MLHGFNVAEQWDRALRQDPPFIFITGWNEWIAGRFDEFNGVRLPVMFVDQFDQEHSRDIEPMTGGHGDNYYYQMIACIRRFKGARSLAPVRRCPSPSMAASTTGAMSSPNSATPSETPSAATIPAGPKTPVTATKPVVMTLSPPKSVATPATVYFYARTQGLLSPSTDPNWMVLFLETDANAATGWLGYDYIVNRLPPKGQTTRVERNRNGQYAWGDPVEIPCQAAGSEIEIAIPIALLGPAQKTATVDFKWADNLQQTGHWSDFTLNGDAAPNDRFNYRARFE